MPNNRDELNELTEQQYSAKKENKEDFFSPPVELSGEKSSLSIGAQADSVSDQATSLNIRILQSCFEWMQAIVVALVVVIVLITFVFRVVDVDGESMQNTLLDGDKVIITNFLYKPKYGDIVVISHGEKYESPIIKRAIAFEGQTVDIDFETGKVTVDGEVLSEPYIKELTKRRSDKEFPLVVPEGKVFVMGDNRMHSLDSRSDTVGFINTQDIIGKAQLVIFPFERFKFLY